jgi:hypothetical protein
VITPQPFRIWDSEEKKIKISRDVCIDELANLSDVPSSAPEDISSFEKFQETMLSTGCLQQMGPINKPKEKVPGYTPTNDENNRETSRATEAEEQAEVNQSTEPCTSAEVEESTLKPEAVPVLTPNEEKIEGDGVDSSVQVPTSTLRRSARGRIPRIIYSMLSLTKLAENPYEPTDYQDAITREDVTLWREKMGEEIQALTTKGTWTLAPCLQGVRPSSVNSSTNEKIEYIEIGHCRILRGPR